MVVRFLVLLLFCSPMIICAQSIEWEIEFDNDSIDIAVSKFINGFDDEVVGIIHKAPIYDSMQAYTTYVYIIDLYGDTLGKCFRKPDTLFIYEDITTFHGSGDGYYLVGYGYALNKNLMTEWFTIFTKVDKDLSVIWEKIVYFDYSFLGFFRALALEDGSLLFASNTSGVDNHFLYHLSSDGDSLSFAFYEGEESGVIWDLTESFAEEEYWLYTYGAYLIPSSNQNCSKITINSTLNQTNHNIFPAWFNPPFSAKNIPENKIVVCGTTEIAHPTTDNEYYISAYQMDTSLNILNHIFLTNPDTISRATHRAAIDYTNPSSIYIGGIHNYLGFWSQSPSWYYLARLDDTLGLVYEKYIGGDEVYDLTSVVATNDGGVLLAGTRRELNDEPYFRDGYFIKFDSTSNPVEISEHSTNFKPITTIYPNPGSHTIYLNSSYTNYEFTLYTALGNRVIKKKIITQNSSIDVSKLHAGMYYYTLINSKELIESGKWIKY